ncbi:molecular chaperone TorD family protein, partial [Turicimonas muris]
MTKRPLNLVLLGLFEPSQELRDMHVFLKAAESLDGKLAEKARRLDDLYTQGTEDAKSFEAMLLDYTRLFLSPGSPPAKNYLTCWKDKLGDKILD